MSPRNRLNRPLGERRYKKLFVLATEGKKTEPEYFSIVEKEIQGLQRPLIKITCLRKKSSSPEHVLKSMKSYLKEKSFNPKIDEAWLVIDRDRWPEQHIEILNRWAQTKENYGLAVSNPNFEYWVLLHYEDGKAIGSPSDCSTRLKKHLPDYDKGLKGSSICLDSIKKAVERAKDRDKPPCLDWPKSSGSTTVYKLVENLLKL